MNDGLNDEIYDTFIAPSFSYDININRDSNDRVIPLT